MCGAVGRRCARTFRLGPGAIEKIKAEQAERGLHSFTEVSSERVSARKQKRLEAVEREGLALSVAEGS